VVSILTGTGFTSQDYGSWAVAAQFVLLLLMFIGGCAGSTTGGLKVIRIEIMLKALWRELFLVIHPRAVRKLRLGAKVLDETLVRNVAVFFFIYIILFLTGALVLGLGAGRCDGCLDCVPQQRRPRPWCGRSRRQLRRPLERHVERTLAADVARQAGDYHRPAAILPGDLPRLAFRQPRLI